MNNNINLPLWETVSHSFLYVVKNIKTFLKICSFAVILWFIEIATNFPSLCLVDKSYCRAGVVDQTVSFLLFLASIIIGVSFIRYIILRQETKWLHVSVGTYTLRYLAYFLLIAIMIIIPSSLMIMIKDIAIKTGASIATIRTVGSVGFLTFVGLSIFCFRLYLVYGASAINDKEMTLSKSYALTQGNTLKMCIGQVLLLIPTIIAVIIVYEIYNLGEWGIVGNSIFVLLGMLLSFFDSTVKASYYAHLYQFFLYAKKK